MLNFITQSPPYSLENPDLFFVTSTARNLYLGSNLLWIEFGANC